MSMDCTVERELSLTESSLRKNPCIETANNYIHLNFPRRYLNSLKHLIPFRKSVGKNDLKLDRAGLFSLISFGWMSELMWKAYKEGINEEDIPLCSKFEMCHPNSQRLSLLWEEELKKNGLKNSSLHRPVWLFIRTRIILAIVVLILTLVFGFIGPTFFMRYLIEWLSTEEPVSVGITWSVCLVLCEGMRVILFGLVWAINYRTALRLKAACLGLVYRKMMHLSNLGDRSIGEVINLFANDGQRIFDFVTLGIFFISGPLVAIAGIVYILLIIGPWALLGMSSFLFFYPCQYIISRMSGRLRRKTIAFTDQRIRMMTEIISCIKLIKMYAWEKCFTKNLTEIRAEERQCLEKAAYVQSISIAMTPFVPVLAAIVTFLSHISAGYSLTAAQAFSLIGALVRVRGQLHYVPYSVVSMMDYQNAIRRMKRFLCMKQMEEYVKKSCKGDFVIVFKEVTFASDIPTQEGCSQKHKKGLVLPNSKDDDTQLNQELLKGNSSSLEILHDLNVKIKKGELVGVCGSVGSGKSSLLLGTLGQLALVRGKVSVGGDCAYVGQQAWILNASLRDNILFGKDFDDKKYYNVLQSCSLIEDVSLLPCGDNTEIGERGMNLSGGQKQRVSLARALYSDKDIYLLDDCLSSVDSHVGQHIFHWVLRSALKNKTVIFVTHQLQYLPECDQVVYLRKGRVFEMGSHSQLMAAQENYSYLFKKHLDTINKKKGDCHDTCTATKSDFIMTGEISSMKTGANDVLKRIQCNKNTDGAQLTSPEEIERGSIPSIVYLKYISFCGGFVVVFAVISTFLLNAAAAGFSSWWLSVWLNAGSGNTTIMVGNETLVSSDIGDNPDVSYYKTIYGLSIIFILVTSLVRGYAFMKITIDASSRMHNSVFEKVFRSPMSFYESTPSGRVINIFSREIDEVDVRLPLTMETFLQNIWVILISLLFVALVFPYFLIFLFILAVIFIYVRHVFKNGVRDLKRFENTSRSPIYTFINTTVSGLQCIQAYQNQDMFLHRFMRLIDDNTSRFFLYSAAVRWLAIRLDLLAVSVTTITAFLCIFLRHSVTAAFGGLALAYASQLSGIFQFTVRLSTETEARFTSVQRIIGYIQSLLEEEPSGVKKTCPDTNWPEFGCILFEKVELTYRANSPLALKGVSFQINSQEKIGVIGRTGSGKSSLGAALFRLVELRGGSIFIDGVNIASVGLEDLRSRLSIIPQDPILFIGTIRYNLDPFNHYSDTELWEAIKKTHMETAISALELNLYSPVTENGNNFSLGERQLLCMARALLRKTKILFLDEATAGIDTETDSRIQSTLNDEFKDCTMITVAHRLNTIMNCSRVLVMHNGDAIEFDSPEALLKNNSSKFSQLVAASKKGIYQI